MNGLSKDLLLLNSSTRTQIWVFFILYNIIAKFKTIEETIPIYLYAFMHMNWAKLFFQMPKLYVMC